MSQPVTLSDFIGSLATASLWTCSHLEHSKVTRSYPVGPGTIRASDMRVWHLGHDGRLSAINGGPDDREEVM